MTQPGQSTPWAKFPIPSSGKVPDVPVDLAAVVDPIDTLLKNVIGGATAPTGPLSPTITEASASIGSLNATQSSQQTDIAQIKDQIARLSAVPWASATARTTTLSITGTTRTPTQVHSMTIPSAPQRRLLMVHTTMSVGWTDNATTTQARARLQLRADGSATYTDRNISITSGVDQTATLSFVETVEAGKSPSVRLTLEVYGQSASSSRILATQSPDPRIYAVALPWSGLTVPYLPV
ncbi:hypothetical protein ACFRMO_07955 [Streptomyces anulatus]|uniref:hypothetical protein n=1 Tax=Streptomyces anulatus TaxID=1892 RepID=UPI0036ABE8B8